MSYAWGESWGNSWGDSWGGSQGDAEVIGIVPSGGYPAYEYPRRTRRDISKDRERFGIKDALALEIIAAVAKRQAESLERDAQKRFEELARQLEIEGLEFEARYLEALNLERERLIDQEIAALLRKKTDEDLQIMMMLVAACV